MNDSSPAPRSERFTPWPLLPERIITAEPGESIGQPRNPDGSINYHFLDGGRWWDSPRCHAGSHCARGINFHDLGKAPRGRHVMAKQSPMESTQGMLEEGD